MAGVASVAGRVSPEVSCRSVWCSPRPRSAATSARSAPTRRRSRSSGYAPPAGLRPRARRRPRGAHAGWTGPYDVDTTFHEPFVLFGYLAAITSLELVTGIIILPQRQTALVAKQAAEVDLLTERPLPARRRPRLERGRVRGAGPGLHRPGPPADRADRAAAPAVDRADRDPRRARTTRVTGGRPRARCRSSGRSRSGSAARPTRPTAGSGRLADGWFPQVRPGPRPRRGARRSSGAAAEAAGPRPVDDRHGGPRRAGTRRDPDRFVAQVGRWRDAGATHLTIDTMRRACGDVDEHLAALDRAWSLLR